MHFFFFFFLKRNSSLLESVSVTELRGVEVWMGLDLTEDGTASVNCLQWEMKRQYFELMPETPWSA